MESPIIFVFLRNENAVVAVGWEHTVGRKSDVTVIFTCNNKNG